MGSGMGWCWKDAIPRSGTDPTTVNGSLPKRTRSGRRRSTSATASAGGANRSALLEGFDDEPRRVQKDVLEHDVQSSCVGWARRKPRNAYARKFRSTARSSAPDYVFVYRGITLFVEFKAPGKTATEKQIEEHDEIKASGGTVWVIDDFEDFKRRWREYFFE